jgi:hypothetical protein
MHWLLLACLASGCTSMTVRTGLVTFGGRPAFQASIEIGPSVIGTRHGFALAGEYGVEADERGARPVMAYNLDLIQNDEDTGPVARIGARLRATLSDDKRRSSGAVLIRSAAFLGLGRDPERRTAGLGIEIAGGVAFEPITQSIFEANLVFGGKVEK